MDDQPSLKLQLKANPERFSERRSELRELVRQPATLQILPLGNNSLRVRVYILDVSPSGLGLHSPVDLPRGTKVHIRLSPMDFVIGKVRHTVRFGDGFYSGIQVDEGKENGPKK